MTIKTRKYDRKVHESCAFGPCKRCSRPKETECDKENDIFTITANQSWIATDDDAQWICDQFKKEIGVELRYERRDHDQSLPKASSGLYIFWSETPLSRLLEMGLNRPDIWLFQKLCAVSGVLKGGES